MSLLWKDDGSLAYTTKDKADALALAFQKPHLRIAAANSPLDDLAQESINRLANNNYDPEVQCRQVHESNLRGASQRPINASRAAVNARMARANQRSIPDDVDLLNASRVAVNSREMHDLARREPPRFCTTMQVQEIIMHLKLKKAAGLDKSTNRLIKSLPPIAIALLTRLFHGCFAISYFRRVWKLAKIIAIPKSGEDSQFPVNNRPISLLSNTGKVFEMLILNHLEAHVSEENLIIKQQSGFREGYSTVQQILRITEKAAINFNLHRSTGLVLLDLEKAFDAVWHDGAIHKMMANSHPPMIVKIVKSFLSSRKAFVDVQGHASEIFDVPDGVPQGSLLSPHLFNLIINDIPIDENFSSLLSRRSVTTQISVLLKYL